MPCDTVHMTCNQHHTAQWNRCSTILYHVCLAPAGESGIDAGPAGSTDDLSQKKATAERIAPCLGSTKPCWCKLFS